MLNKISLDKQDLKYKWNLEIFVIIINCLTVFLWIDFILCLCVKIYVYFKKKKKKPKMLASNNNITFCNFSYLASI